MSHTKLRRLLFWTLCCDLGLFSKQLISPFANLITDALRIPGGISTGFSLMFLTIAAEVMPGFGCATLMAAVQSLLALALGRVGSMGLLSPVGYILPGIAMDIAFRLLRRRSSADRMVLANAAASLCAGLTANAIVFHLTDAALLLYASIGTLSGALFGLLGSSFAPRIARAVHRGQPKEDTHS